MNSRFLPWHGALLGAMLLMGGGAVAVGALNQSPPRDHRTAGSANR